MHLLCFVSLFKEWLWWHFIDKSIHFWSNRKNLDTYSGHHGPWWGDNRSSSCGFSDLVACSGKRGTGLATNLQCCCCCREDQRCQWRHWAPLDWQELKPDIRGNQVQKSLAQPAVQGVLFQWLCRIWEKWGEGGENNLSWFLSLWDWVLMVSLLGPSEFRNFQNFGISPVHG